MSGVPNRKLAQLSGREICRRLPKLPVADKHYVSGYQGTFGNYTPTVTKTSTGTIYHFPNAWENRPATNTLRRALEESALPKHEFRFWRGSPVTNLAVCHACQHFTFNAQERREHMEKTKCTTKLVAAYSLLLRDSKCVVCDRETTGRSWGIPLCSDPCTFLFAFGSKTPSSLLQAIKLVEGAY